MKNVLAVFFLLVEVAIILLFVRHYASKDREERELIQLLGHWDYSTRSYAIEKLVELRSRNAIPYIIKLLDYDADYIRDKSAIALALGELDAKESIPKITELLKQETMEIKYTTSFCADPLFSYQAALIMLGVSDEEIKNIIE